MSSGGCQKFDRSARFSARRGSRSGAIYPSYQKPGEIEGLIKKENFTKRWWHRSAKSP